MARKPRRGNVTVFTSHYDEETDIETDINVECLVTPGEREIRWGDNACPGSPPEVEIIEALDDTGKDWREEIESDGRWFDRVSEDAINEANEYDGPDTIAEARGER